MTVIADFLNPSPGDIFEDLGSSLLYLATTLLLTGLGIGSILGWAIRLTATHLASVAMLAMRIWLVIAFLVLIAVAFVLTGVVERVHQALASTTTHDTDSERLAGTPFEAQCQAPCWE